MLRPFRRKNVSQFDTSADILNPENPLYKTLIDSIYDGVVVQDHTGKVVATNLAARRILKLPDEKIKGTTSLSPQWKNIHEDGTDFPGPEHPAMLVLKTKKPVNDVVMGFVNQNNEVTWLRVCANPIIKDGKLKYVVATFTDITKEKQANQELKNLYYSSSDILAVVKKNGDFIQVNDSIEKILGIDADIFISNDISKYIHKEDLDKYRLLLKSASVIGKNNNSIIRLRNNKNEYVYIEISISSLGDKYYLIGRDVTTKIEKEKIDSLYSDLLQRSVDAIYFKDLKGNITAWNKSAERIYGFKAEEIVGKPIDLIIPKDHDDHDYIFAKIHSGKSITDYETIRQRKDGQLINVSLSITPVKDEEGKIYGASIICRDITESKNNNLKLKELKDRLALAATAGKIGVWELDIENDHLTWDDRMYKIYGLNSTDSINSFAKWSKYIVEEDREKVHSAIERVKKENSLLDITFRIRWPNKNIRHIKATGSIINKDTNSKGKLIGVSSDVTTDMENIKSIERFKLAVEAAYDHVIITDKEGKIIYANSSAERTTGYSKDEMLGKTPALWGKQMPKEFYKNMWHTLTDLKQPFIGELTNKRKSGELYIAESHISPILDESGKNIEYFLGIEKDITKLKEVDKAKTEFVSLASHQLRTPLSAVNWYAELLLDADAGILNEEQKSYVNEIYAGNQRMVSLVNALLNVSRLEMGTFEVEPKDIKPQEYINDVLQDLKLQIEGKNLEINNNTKDKINTFHADPDIFRIIVQNLITNAVKYTQKGGKIEYSLGYKGDKFVIIVSDNGRGIPSHQKDRIFTKLFRADNVKQLDIEGTGLGLYLVKTVVDKLGGDISFTSQLNKGASFTVTLPKNGMTKKAGSRSLL